MTYTLQTPYKSRRDGQDVDVTELEIPEVVTVKMLRKVPPGNTMTKAHALVEACTGMSAFDAAKLTTPDALGYSEALGDRLIPHDEPSFKVPDIKPVKTLIQKITVDVDHPVEFAAQVLQAQGMPRAEIDEMDVRGFIPVIDLIMGAFVGPKR